jgi:preprotein translocase subunit YajC
MNRKQIFILSLILAVFFFIMAKLEQQDQEESFKIDRAVLEKK